MRRYRRRKGYYHYVLIALLALAAIVAARLEARQKQLPATGTVEVAFSPHDDPEALIINMINAAQNSIYVQAYIFTSQNIADALVHAHRRGVYVDILADSEMNQRGAGKALPKLLAAGIPLAFETQYNAAHNKVIIADPLGPGCAVLTGSYNFTWSARNRNAENVLLMRDNCPLAEIYLNNWKRHRAEAKQITRLPAAR